MIGCLAGALCPQADAVSFSGRVVPIAITQTTYNSAIAAHQLVSLTLISAKKEALSKNEFVLMDLRSASNNANSPAHMRRQLTGEENLPISLAIL